VGIKMTKTIATLFSGGNRSKKIIHCKNCDKAFTSFNKNPCFCSIECKGASQQHKLNSISSEVISFYLQGNTLIETANHFDSTEKVVTNILKRNQIDRRKAIKRNQLGSNNSFYRGAKTLSKSGYVLVACEGHPRACKEGNYVLEHILVMEKHLGRYLNYSTDPKNRANNEVVHHINFNKQDNRIENLQLMTQSQHTTLHNNLRQKESKS
jgi:hypothetical protein